MATVAIIDYGLGNIRSVRGAVERIGHRALVSGVAAELRAADALILPGVGAYGDGMIRLRERQLIEPLNELVLEEKKPILGICLGAQLMAETGSEFGRHQGLGWIRAEVKKLQVGELSLPHVGWNDLEFASDSPLYSGIEGSALVYFVHSFHVDCRDSSIVTSRCHHGQDFVASFEFGNIFGTQFHPEKSQACGLKILENFLSLAVGIGAC